jgi:(S)-mandelate dehydrogenase
MHPRWLAGVLGRYLLTSGMPRYMNFPPETQTRITSLPMGRSTALNASITWDDVRELRRLWPGTLIVKGIQHARDAVLAADAGADAVVLSNHGGRVLDASDATINALPRVVEAVKKRITVIVDSGFRRGSDVVKALALGADAVMVGRAPLHGTASAGEAGARRALEIYRDEIDRVLALVGCTSIGELTREHVVMPGGGRAAEM